MKTALEKVAGDVRHSLASKYTRILHRHPEISVLEKIANVLYKISFPAVVTNYFYNHHLSKVACELLVNISFPICDQFQIFNLEREYYNLKKKPKKTKKNNKPNQILNWLFFYNLKILTSVITNIIPVGCPILL